MSILKKLAKYFISCIAMKILNFMSKEEDTKVSCDGQDNIKHPKIYIEYKENEKVVKCQYCGKIFNKYEK
ncbi:Putative zinc-finger domain protein [Candidatus Deianiraea vastatrix]|uniref:Zinc-finger domain protein n=2 Tax=Candidatus Deianiraea vastatrix TaxID=2163644 RepID=A0A5B8XBV9_9RICK|nr:Putative zinc-finger domain protein [Candidatus Deianiraea vastatrix]